MKDLIIIFREKLLKLSLQTFEIMTTSFLSEKELLEMHTSGKVDWHSDEIKAKYKNTYNTLFDNYVDGEENGIETTNFKLIEKSEEIFTISKK